MPAQTSTQARRWRVVVARAVPATLLAIGAGLLAPAVPASAAGSADGAQTSGDALFPNVGNGGYDALHYDVSMTWDPSGVVNELMTGSFTTASATMTAQTIGAPLRSFSLDFEGLDVDTIIVDGSPATWVREEDAAAQKHKLIITPAEPVDGTFTVEVRYHGTPQVHVDPDGYHEGWGTTKDGATLLSSPVGSMTAYPNNNTPRDKATYTIAVDVPTTLTSETGTGTSAAVSNGELVSKMPSSDATRTTWTWSQRQPMASDATVISIGKYDVIESSVTLSNGRTIPEWTFMDSDLSASNKATITSRRSQLGTFLGRLESIYGPYPGNSTGIVVDPVSTRMDTNLGTQDRPFFNSAALVENDTLVRDLARQWYGANVSPDSQTDTWLGDGMATWAATWHRNVLAPATPDAGVVEATYYNQWTNSAPGNYTVAPGAQTDAAQLGDQQTVARSAQFWEALRTALRDRDYFSTVKQWQTRNAGQSRSGDDLKALAEEISGRDLAAFWQDWIYDADKPAWPGMWDASLTSPTDGAVVRSGDVVDYTVRATNVGRVKLTGQRVSVDLSDVLDDATLAPLPAGAALSGTTLTWAVPPTALDAAQVLTFSARVNEGAPPATMNATAEVNGLGGLCSPCTTRHGVEMAYVSPAPAPSLPGVVRVGSTVAATVGAWADGADLTYQWAVDGVDVEGQTQSTYTPRAADVNRDLTVAVTGTKAGFLPVTRVSDPTTVALGRLSVTPVPELAGAPVVDGTLTAVTGRWDAGVSLSYGWTVNGFPLASANGPRLGLTDSDLGKKVAVTVTATKPGYQDEVRTSLPVTVAEGTLAALAPPRIDGTPVYGQTLTAASGTWNVDPRVSFQWTRNGVPVSGATGDAYTLTEGDLGARVGVVVTGTKTGYTPTTAVSAATAPVALATWASGRVRVAGKARAGRVLSARVRGFDSATVSYTWFAGKKKVGSRATLRLKSAHAGKKIKVRVRVARPGYVSQVVTSKAKTRVARRR